MTELEKSWYLTMAIHPKNRERSSVLAAYAVIWGAYPDDLKHLSSDCAAHVEAWLCDNGQGAAVEAARRSGRKRGTAAAFRHESIIVRVLNFLQGVR